MSIMGRRLVLKYRSSYPPPLPRAQLQALYMISTIYQHFRVGRWEFPTNRQTQWGHHYRFHKEVYQPTKTVRSWARLLYTLTMEWWLHARSEMLSVREILAQDRTMCFPFMSLFSWFWLSLIEMSPWSAQLNEGLSSVKGFGVLEGSSD